MIVVKLLTRRPVQQNICSIQRNKKETQRLGVHPTALSLFISVNIRQVYKYGILSTEPFYKPLVKLINYLGGLTSFLLYLRDFHPLCSTSNHPRTPNYYVRLFISCLHTCIPQSQISACGGKSLSELVLSVLCRTPLRSAPLLTLYLYYTMDWFVCQYLFYVFLCFSAPGRDLD